MIGALNENEEINRELEFLFHQQMKFLTNENSLLEKSNSAL